MGVETPGLALRPRQVPPDLPRLSGGSTSFARQRDVRDRRFRREYERRLCWAILGTCVSVSAVRKRRRERSWHGLREPEKFPLLLPVRR